MLTRSRAATVARGGGGDYSFDALQRVMCDAWVMVSSQADDDTLPKLSARIEARTVRQRGELLKQFEERGGDRSKTNGHDSFNRSRGEAAATRASWAGEFPCRCF